MNLPDYAGLIAEIVEDLGNGLDMFERLEVIPASRSLPLLRFLKPSRDQNHLPVLQTVLSVLVRMESGVYG